MTTIFLFPRRAAVDCGLLIKPFRCFAMILLAMLLVVSSSISCSLSDDPDQAESHQQTGVALKQVDVDSLIQIASDPEDKRQQDAILQLGSVREKLNLVVPLLAKFSHDTHELNRLSAAIALQKIGSTGPPYLKAMLESGDPIQVSQASSALKELGPAAKMYFPQVRTWLESEDRQLKMQALFVLQGVGEESVELLDLVILELDHPDFNVQCWACRVLEKIGPAAEPAEPALLRILDDGITSAQGWAAIALGASSDKQETVSVLIEKLSAPSQSVKQRALRGLGHMGHHASAAADPVHELMLDESKSVAHYAAFAYWKITGETQESLDILRQKLDSQSYRDDTIELVGKMESAGASLAGPIAQHLSSQEASTRELALVALSNLGSAAIPYRSDISKLLEDEDPIIRYRAAETLALPAMPGTKP